MIGKIERVPLREVWKHEALDFTKWLEDNPDALGEATGLALADVEREHAAGEFRADLVARNEAGNLVIIENQLGRSDHDHLGKIVTYLSVIGAEVAIWIVADPRPEHGRAVAWLNESSSASFYLVKVEAVRIGESPPAPLLTLIVGPSEESRQVGKTKKELAERDVIRQRFWTGLLERAKARTKLHASISAGKRNWIGAAAGKAGLTWDYGIREHDGQVELYIDRGRDAGKENEAIFDALAASKDAAEAVFGEPLEWQRLEGKRCCAVSKRLDTGGYRDEERWPEIQEAMVDAMIRLEKALRPYIDKLKV